MASLNKVVIKMKMFILCIILLLQFSCFSRDMKFDSQRWLQSEDRVELAYIFIEKIYVNGMNRDELIGYLGKPWLEYSSDTMVSYIIGHNVIDYIVLTFDMVDDKVVSYEIWQTT